MWLEVQQHYPTLISQIRTKKVNILVLKITKKWKGTQQVIWKHWSIRNLYTKTDKKYAKKKINTLQEYRYLDVRQSHK